MDDRFAGFFSADSPAGRMSREIDYQRLPLHVALIMDGNGRWAEQNRLKRHDGHRQGGEAAREVSECAMRLGIRHLTLFAFSSENWKRPVSEVRFLMDLLFEYFSRSSEKITDLDVRLKVIGEKDKLPARLLGKIEELERATAEKKTMQLNLALNYGSRQEILAAARALLSAGLKAADLDEQKFNACLYTAGSPDPDLMIRTSGEMRLSNFLLFQSAYTELYFTPTLWPDFRSAEFLQAIVEFQRRRRRFGAL